MTIGPYSSLINKSIAYHYLTILDREKLNSLLLTGLIDSPVLFIVLGVAYQFPPSLQGEEAIDGRFFYRFFLGSIGIGLMLTGWQLSPGAVLAHALP